MKIPEILCVYVLRVDEGVMSEEEEGFEEEEAEELEVREDGRIERRVGRKMKQARSHRFYLGRGAHRGHQTRR